jgi:Skp family chaperone for outer membrane proteins
MRLFQYASAAALAAVAFSLAPSALAQRGSAAQVVVVNYQRIASESALGRDMTTKLQGIRTQIQQQAQALQPEQQAIEQERERLMTASHGMTPAQIQANATLRPQFDAFNQRVQQFQARGQGLQGDYECTQAIALRAFTQQVSPVIQAAMTQRGAGVVIDSENVQAVAPQYDITNTIIQQLDQNPATRTATVARHALSECQPQQAAQPAAAPH